MNAIEIHKLNMSYKHKVLNDLDLNLEYGQIVGLVGENGTGKSTLLRILAGLEMTYKGDVKVNGEKPGASSKSYVSYQPDKFSLDESLSVKETMDTYKLFFDDFDDKKFKALLADFKLPFDSKIKEMSKGMKDKIQIALSLSRNAKIFLLDEPISGVDPSSRKIIIDAILKNFDENSLLIISTHLINAIEPLLDRVVFLSDGKIFLNESVDYIRDEKKMSIEDYFTEVF